MSSNICLQCFQNFRSENHTFCSERCFDEAASQAPGLIKIPINHVMFENVATRFLDGWKGRSVPSIRRIYLITWEPHARLRFEIYRDKVESLGNFTSEGLSMGNEKKRFRGVDRYCTLGEAGNTELCNHPDCKLCECINEGFGPYLQLKRTTGFHGTRLGPGLYTTADSSKADKYAKNHDPNALHKAMLVCRVVLGRPFRTTKDIPALYQPPKGYDSVHAVPGPSSSFSTDERVVYNKRAMMPAYLIVYDKI